MSLIYFDGEKFALLPQGETGKVIPLDLAIQWYAMALELVDRIQTDL